MKKICLLLISALLLTTEAKADTSAYEQSLKNESATLIRPVIGLDYVYSKADYAEFIDDLFNDEFNSFAISGGIKVGQYAGLEAFFQQSGDSKIEFYDYDVESSLSFYAWGADAVLYLPLLSSNEDSNPTVNLLATAGLGRYKLDGDLFGIPVSGSMTAPRFGAGVEFGLNQNLAIRAMGRYVRFDDEYLDSMLEFSLGIRAYF